MPTKWIRYNHTNSVLFHRIRKVFRWHRPIGWNDIEYSRKYTINMRTSHWIRTQLTNWPQTSSESSGSCNRGCSSNTSTVWHRDFIAPGLCVNRVEYMTDEGIVTFGLVGNVYDVSLTTNLSFRPAWRRNGQVIRCGWRGIALRNVRRLLQSSGRSRRHNGYILHQDQWLCSRRPTIRQDAMEDEKVPSRLALLWISPGSVQYRRDKTAVVAGGNTQQRQSNGNHIELIPVVTTSLAACALISDNPNYTQRWSKWLHPTEFPIPVNATISHQKWQYFRRRRRT